MDTQEIKKLASQQCEKALNRDWKNRGDLRIEQVTKATEDIQGIPLEATVAVVSFEKPLTDPLSIAAGHESGDYEFDGFVLAIVEKNGKVYTEATPKFSRDIGPRLLNRMHEVLYKFSSRICPNCHKFDSVKRRIVRRGPELIVYEYKCRCGYTDMDVLD